MNWIAMGIYLLLIVFVWWLYDLIDYLTWQNPEFHKGQKRRVQTVGIGFLIVGLIAVGKIFA